MSSQVRPSFFCSRPNGSLTPLIALDDLPAGVTIRGISRTLTPGETQGMISCGTSESRSEPWTLEGVTPAGKDTTASNEDASELQAVLLKILSDDSVPTHLRMAINAILYRHSGASLPLAAPVTEAVTGRQSAPPVYYGNSRGHAYHKHVSD
ncbi:hypothetical protein F1880_004289 [Penicillium rolfsii]|nr:hypothetical protein F1880_004289 [Penicillium rolfsii]